MEGWKRMEGGHKKESFVLAFPAHALRAFIVCYFALLLVPASTHGH
jgi:hypothetical protein